MPPGSPFKRGLAAQLLGEWSAESLELSASSKSTSVAESCFLQISHLSPGKFASANRERLVPIMDQWNTVLTLDPHPLHTLRGWLALCQTWMSLILLLIHASFPFPSQVWSLLHALSQCLFSDILTNDSCRQIAGKNMRFSTEPLLMTGSEASLTSESGSSENPRHKVIIQLLKWSPVLNWDNVTVGRECIKHCRCIKKKVTIREIDLIAIANCHCYLEQWFPIRGDFAHALHPCHHRIVIMK